MSRFFAILTLQTLLQKSLPTLFIETAISENVGNLRMKAYFTVIVSKNKTFFAIKLETRFYRTKCIRILMIYFFSPEIVFLFTMVKSALSGLKRFLANESLLKMMQNAFY